MAMGSHRYASLGQRAIAYLVDGILVGIVAKIILFFLIQGAITTGDITGIVIGGTAVFVMTWVYFIILEGLYGVTIGKRLLGIEVTDENGNVPGMVPALIRNVLRIVDQLPQFYIIGIILIYVNDDNQRLGDMLANTYVVRS